MIRAYEVIGEIAKRLPDLILNQQPHIEWKRIKGFRDFLAHNYEDVVLSIVWGAVEQVSELTQAVDALIQSTKDAN